MEGNETDISAVQKEVLNETLVRKKNIILGEIGTRNAHFFEQELDKLKFLTSIDVEVALMEPTANGLSKSIFDATQPIREFLKKKNVHDYQSQHQGTEQKVILKTKIITSDDIIETKTSLYRPNTKSGDPRIWFSGIGEYCKPTNILALFYFDNLLWVFNLTTIEVQHGFVRDVLLSYQKSANSISDELLIKLKSVASRGFDLSSW